MEYPEINSQSRVLMMENEKWKPVKGWESFYSVSDFGRVKREERSVIHSNQVECFSMTYPEKVLKANLDSKGYPQVTLNAKHFFKQRRVARVHRLVAEAFIPNLENKEQVNHRNSIRTDASVGNLEWSTASENQRHSYDVGGRQPQRGLENGVCKYSEDTVRAVYILATTTDTSQAEIGKLYSMPQITVSNIKTKKTWRHITDNLTEVH
jgi:hypothetical protein